MKIFRAELSPAIAANPFISFFTVATESGTIAFDWTRRQRLCRERARRHHDRMTRGPRRWSCVAAMVLAVAIGAQAGDIPANQRRSDYELMGPELRQMQDDDAANPGMLWVSDGEALWQRKDGSAGQILRRLSRRGGAQHEGRRCALPRVRPEARPANRSGRAHQRSAERRTKGWNPWHSKARSCCR